VPTTIIPAQITTALPAARVQQLAKAAQDFEAMALGQLLKPMFETVGASKGPFGGGTGEETWRPMMVQEMAKNLAKGGGLGLARPVLQQMIRTQEINDAKKVNTP